MLGAQLEVCSHDALGMLYFLKTAVQIGSLNGLIYT